MATLTSGTTVVNLSDDLHWEDQFDWTPVEQSATRSLSGNLIVECSETHGGRPITLSPSDENSAWTKYDDVLKLNLLAKTPGLTMQLSYRGLVRDVMFRHQDRDPVSAKPVVAFSDPVGDDPYLVTIKLMEI